MTPLILFQFYNEHAYQQIRMQIMQDEALRIAGLVDTQLLRIVDGADEVLGVIGDAPDVQDGDLGDCNRLVTNVLAHSPRYAGLAVIGIDGHPLCERMPAKPGMIFSDRAYFKRAMETGRLAVGDFVAGRRDGNPTIHLARPFTDANGKVQGVVALALRLDWLNARLAELPLPPGTSASIADRNGTLLARFPNPDAYIGRKVAAGSPLSLEGDKPGVGMVTAADGTARVAAWLPPGAEPNHFFVGVGLDRNRLYREITADNRLGTGLIIVVTLLSLAVTAFFGIQLIQWPLLRLLASTDRWRAGELAVRSGVAHDESEFGRLAEALDGMAETMQAREAVLRESEERLRLAMVTARLGVRELDIETGQATSSPEAEEIFGHDPERDKTFETWFARVHPDDQAMLKANWDHAKSNPGVDIEHEYRFCKPDGSWRWIAAHGRLMFRDGKPVRTVGVIQDVTDRRRMQDQLRALTRSLETRVQQEIAAREAAQLRAAHGERMQALGQLAGGIAHDFNNVLQAIAGALRLIARRPGDAEGVARLVQLASDAAERGASVTRRLLAFGRRADLRTEPIDAGALLHDLHEILTHTLGSAIEVRIVVEAGLPAFTADRSQLETSLINLATNARDAMPQGGVLTLTAAAETVSESRAGGEAKAGSEALADEPRLPAGSYVRIAIADTGSGMEAAVLARASEPFFTTKKDGAGTGLGLAMAKGFVEQSGGRLQIESALGRGTCITIWLPQAQALPETASRPRIAAEPMQHAGEVARPRILLVDDDEAVRSVLQMELEAAGFPVLSVSSGEKAIALLDGGAEVEALISDLSLPGMDGLAIIRAVQQRRSGLPAILLTGYAGEGASRAVGGVVEGSFTLLRKPASGVQLIDMLETLLTRKGVGAG